MPDSDVPLLDMYRTMLTIRRFEERCNHLYLQGRIPSTLHLYIGQEAVATGVCAHLGSDDYLYSTHRPHGHALAKGVSPRSIMAELFGKRTGCCQGKGGSMHVGDVNVGMFPAIAIVGANAPLAAGSALAAKRLTEDRLAVCFMGDGALNEGAVHEAMNMSALWDLPVIFVCENNLYAASTPLDRAFRNQDLAGRALAYGIPAVVVDGNDVEAVYQAAGEAVTRARRREGSTFLEAQTYRLCGHSRSDPRTYRSPEEEEAWQSRDPIPRLAARLKQSDLASDKSLAAIEQDVLAILDDAVAFAEESPLPEPTDTLDHVYWSGPAGQNNEVWR
jgi:pyruvate dehydrogenase E1 component alpha subunit